jgi:transcriptional regulator with XRE-family HTH domain
MTEDQKVPRFVPPTPRSRRLGRELRRLRDGLRVSAEDAASGLGRSQSWVSRVEAGEIRPRPGDVMEILTLYGVPLDDERSKSLLDLARQIREPGWWQRLGRLSSKYLQFIAFEAEATELRNFEPTLVPGLLQTEAYARAVIGVGKETESEAIEQSVRARMKRQEVLTRTERPLRLVTVLSEAVLLCKVGGPEVLREQLSHLAEVSKLPNVTIQILTFDAGAHLADNGGFAILSFGTGDPDLGYVETPAGELFLELEREIGRLRTVFDHLRTLALSPAESTRMIKETANR